MFAGASLDENSGAFCELKANFFRLILTKAEVTGLRWCDIDLEDGIIDVNHTLVYYDHRTSEGRKGCYFNVNTSKDRSRK